MKGVGTSDIVQKVAVGSTVPTSYTATGAFADKAVASTKVEVGGEEKAGYTASITDDNTLGLTGTSITAEADKNVVITVVLVPDTYGVTISTGYEVTDPSPAKLNYNATATTVSTVKFKASTPAAGGQAAELPTDARQITVTVGSGNAAVTATDVTITDTTEGVVTITFKAAITAAVSITIDLEADLT